MNVILILSPVCVYIPKWLAITNSSHTITSHIIIFSLSLSLSLLQSSNIWLQIYVVAVFVLISFIPHFSPVAVVVVPPCALCCCCTNWCALLLLLLSSRACVFLERANDFHVFSDRRTIVIVNVDCSCCCRLGLSGRGWTLQQPL